MKQASAHAQKLAREHGVDLEKVTGTGNEGLITKSDVEGAIARGDAGFTNIMEAQKAARGDASADVPEAEVEIALPSQEEMLELIKSMREEIQTLRTVQAGLIDSDNYGRDLTDDMFFIRKPNGRRWEERRIVNKRTEVIDQVGSAFYGPFEDKDTIELYLKHKRRKREDSYIEWETIEILTGREARAIDRQEKEAREARFSAEEDRGSTNVLDRRMWAEHGWGQASQSGVGTVVGPAD